MAHRFDPPSPFFTRIVSQVLWRATVTPIQPTTTIIRHWALCDNIRAEGLACNRSTFFFGFASNSLFLLGASLTAEMRNFCAFCPFVCFACLQMFTNVCNSDNNNNSHCHCRYVGVECADKRYGAPARRNPLCTPERSDNCVLHKYFATALLPSAELLLPLCIWLFAYAFSCFAFSPSD